MRCCEMPEYMRSNGDVEFLRISFLCDSSILFDDLFQTVNSYLAFALCSENISVRLIDDTLPLQESFQC